MHRKAYRIYIISAFSLFFITLLIISAYIPRGAEDEPVQVVIKNGMTLNGIGRLLKKEGLIFSSTLFGLFAYIKGGKLIAGEYTFKKNMSTMDIIKKMIKGERNIYVLRIVEGHNIYNVAETMEKANIMKREDFLSLATDKGFMERLGIKGDSLEGYLAPDTYHYSKEIEIEKFIEKIVQRTFKFFEKKEVQERLNTLNMDIHKVLTLASIIEKEAKIKEEKPIISAVFHNRLKKNMPLDADPTVIYGTGGFSRPITKTDLTSPTPYNTYTFKGLPKGPICNPDKNSILAALNPGNVDFLYFVSKNDGTHIFSRDIASHRRFVTVYQRRNTKKQ